MQAIERNPTPWSALDDVPALMTAQQVADRLQVPVGHIRRWANAGQLPGTWMGQRTGYRFTPADVQTLLENRRVRFEDE